MVSNDSTPLSEDATYPQTPTLIVDQADIEARTTLASHIFNEEHNPSVRPIPDASSISIKSAPSTLHHHRDSLSHAADGLSTEYIQLLPIVENQRQPSRNEMDVADMRDTISGIGLEYRPAGPTGLTATTVSATEDDVHSPPPYTPGLIFDPPAYASASASLDTNQVDVEAPHANGGHVQPGRPFLTSLQRWALAFLAINTAIISFVAGVISVTHT